MGSLRTSTVAQRRPNSLEGRPRTHRVPRPCVHLRLCMHGVLALTPHASRSSGAALLTPPPPPPRPRALPRSRLAAMFEIWWWCLQTLTSEGYGVPWVPITDTGKVLAVAVALVGTSTRARGSSNASRRASSAAGLWRMCQQTPCSRTPARRCRRGLTPCSRTPARRCRRGLTPCSRTPARRCRRGPLADGSLQSLLCAHQLAVREPSVFLALLALTSSPFAPSPPRAPPSFASFLLGRSRARVAHRCRRCDVR